MEIIRAAPGDRLNIGRKGEHLARQVQFDLTTWAETYGEGRAELFYQRPDDLHAYPIATRRQGNLLLWDITKVDTAQAGKNGRAEIRYYVEDVLVILEISYILVEQTLDLTEKIPAMPKADWFEQVLEQVRRVEAPVTSPPIINDETGTWMIFDPEVGQYENTGYPATGRDGIDGKDGLNGFDGKDGKDGAPGKDGIDGSNGITPHIGANGNWWVGDTDTNIAAQGPQGPRGPRGYDGPEGPSGERGPRGYDGEDGRNGRDGVGIRTIEYTPSDQDGGVNLFRIEMTNDDFYELSIKNGSRGSDGADGSDANVTAENITAALGYTPANAAEVSEGSEAIPEYWKDELATKASAIQTAMEKAGRNKSAFLWYTDAHWVNGNSKVSPKLLNYLYEHTPMNKVNFGGDIIGDTLLATRDDMEYLYEWRKAIKDLPNHHSVLGNHDSFSLDTVDYEDDNYRYAFLLAPEETPDMVMGDGNYYYIDNPAEKTRYLYFAYLTTGQAAMMAQGQFMVDAIKGVPEGWHIVAINHRWWQYSKSSTPTTGSIPPFETDMLSVFDAYNARVTRGGSNYFYAQDFTNAKGKVEFCIGGHIHVDYDMESDGGIPIIITTSDTNQNRVPDSTVDCGTVGTTTEAAVFGIIADYNDSTKTKITVVGVGRGTSRVVRPAGAKVTSISEITYSGDTTIGAAIDKSKFSFKVNYSDGTSDTVTGATSVSASTIGVVGDNSVTITYMEGTVTVSGTATIVGTAVPTVNLLNLNRTFEAGTSGTSMGASHLDESKAFTNVGYSNLAFLAKSCAVSDVTENGITYTESGIGGSCISYPVHLPDIDTQDYKISFDYTGNGTTRVYYKFGKTDGTFSVSQTALSASGSNHVDYTIPHAGSNVGTGFEWLIISLGASTGKTATISNVSLTKSDE